MPTRANLVEEKVMIKELMKIIVLVAIHVLAFYTLPFGERVKIAILVTTLSTITVGRLTWIMAPEGYRPYRPALLRTCLNVAGGVLGVFGFLGVMFLGSNSATLAIILALVFFSVAEVFRHITSKFCPTGLVPKKETLNEHQ